MRKALLGLCVLAVAFWSCSNGEERTAGRPPVHERNAPQRPPAAARQDDSFLRVASLTLSPEAPSISDDIKAEAVLAGAPEGNIEFHYQWFVNGHEVEQADGDTLGKSSLKKGAWVFCQVKAVDGQRESPALRSDLVRVRNSPPLLDLPPVGTFSIPGEFQYQAAARDADGDEMAFTLVSPTDQGIAVDPKSGRLSWNLTEEAVKALGEKVVITIAVSDGEDKAEGTIALSFTSTTQQK